MSPFYKAQLTVRLPSHLPDVPQATVDHMIAALEKKVSDEITKMLCPAPISDRSYRAAVGLPLFLMPSS